MPQQQRRTASTSTWCSCVCACGSSIINERGKEVKMNIAARRIYEICKTRARSIFLWTYFAFLPSYFLPYWNIWNDQCKVWGFKKNSSICNWSFYLRKRFMAFQTCSHILKDHVYCCLFWSKISKLCLNQNHWPKVVTSILQVGLHTQTWCFWLYSARVRVK